LRFEISFEFRVSDFEFSLGVIGVLGEQLAQDITRGEQARPLKGMG
jgi:hypothetical protein